MIDVHCHLDFEAFDLDRAGVLERAAAAGVTDVVVPGVSRTQWAAAMGVTRWEPSRPPQRHLCIGVHPAWLATEVVREQALRQAVDTYQPVAIGEFGLDVRVGGADAAIQQEDAALAHLRVARETELPVVLHVVRRHGRMLELLDEVPARGFVHGFTGAPEVAEGYVERGLMVSFGPKVLDPRAKKARAAVAAVPLASLLVETDAPRPRGERGEPRDVEAIAQGIAALRGECADEVLAATRANARRVFGLDAS